MHFILNQLTNIIKKPTSLSALHEHTHKHTHMHTVHGHYLNINTANYSTIFDDTPDSLVVNGSGVLKCFVARDSP